jgi:hypothetical protein
MTKQLKTGQTSGNAGLFCWFGLARAFENLALAIENGKNMAHAEPLRPG